MKKVHQIALFKTSFSKKLLLLRGHIPPQTPPPRVAQAWRHFWLPKFGPPPTLKIVPPPMAQAAHPQAHPHLNQIWVLPQVSPYLKWFTRCKFYPYLCWICKHCFLHFSDPTACVLAYWVIVLSCKKYHIMHFLLTRKISKMICYVWKYSGGSITLLLHNLQNGDSNLYSYVRYSSKKRTGNLTKIRVSCLEVSRNNQLNLV